MRVLLRSAARAFGEALLLVTMNRAALLFATWLSVSAPPVKNEDAEAFSLFQPFSMLMRWDAFFYLKIASEGYTNISDAFEHRDTNFWPLFPWLWRLTHAVIPSWALSGFILNLLLLTVAVASVHDIAKKVLSPAQAKLAPLLFLAQPGAFYYSAYYTESAFACFAALSVCLAYRRSWALASLAAGLAGGTRMVGIAPGLAVVMAYAESIDFDYRKIARSVLWLPLIGLGTVTYVSYLAWNFHEPFAFTAGLHARDWGADVTWARFLQTTRTAIRISAWPLPWREATDMAHLVILGFTIVVTALGVRSLRPSLVVFSVVAIFLSCRYWTNAGRYCAPIFPATLILAKWLESRPNFLLFVLLVGALGSAVVGWMYVHNFWVS
jgi:hypothetical protein